MERYIKQAFLTFLLLFAVSTAVWAGNGPPPGACCIPSGEPTECDIGSEAFCNNAGGAYQGDGTTCDNNPCDLPPTRDINVRVIAICAAPVGVEPHDGGDGISCLCFGRFFNGFNATGTQPNGRCARSQVGPFCFVDTIVGPLFWKETVEDESGPTTVDPGNIVEATVRCPDGKMVLSCQGEVLVGDTTEPAANVASYKFPTDDGLACKHVARTDEQLAPPPDPCAEFEEECPCDFSSLPPDTTCWEECTGCVGDPSFTPCTTPSCGTLVDICRIQQQIATQQPDLTVIRFFGNARACSISIFFGGSASCNAPPPIDIQNLTEGQFSSCLCRLGQYADELASNGINIIDSGPPFSCEPPPEP